jgi:hypothetical protein
MDDKRRDDADRTPDRETSNRHEEHQRDDLAHRREIMAPHQALTRRERQERWPIG